MNNKDSNNNNKTASAFDKVISNSILGVDSSLIKQTNNETIIKQSKDAAIQSADNNVSGDQTKKKLFPQLKSKL